MFINPINSINQRKQSTKLKFQNNSLNQQVGTVNYQQKKKNVSFGQKQRLAVIASENFLESDFEQKFVSKMQPYADIIKSKVTQFANTELNPNLTEKIDEFAGGTVVMLQTLGKNINDSIMGLLFKINAARRAGVEDIKLVIPHMPYARGERQMKSGEGIPFSTVTGALYNEGASTVTGVLYNEGGGKVNHLIVGDIHNKSAIGDNRLLIHDIPSEDIILKTLQDKNVDFKNTVILSPDMGGYKRAEGLAKKINSILKEQNPLNEAFCDTAVISKNRYGTNQTEITKFFGDVKDKDVIIVDDMIDTAGTITQAAKAVNKAGAKRVFLVAPHGLFNGEAVDRLQTAPVDGIFTTNAVNIPEQKQIALQEKHFEMLDFTDPFAWKLKQLLGIKEPQTLTI